MSELSRDELEKKWVNDEPMNVPERAMATSIRLRKLEQEVETLRHLLFGIADKLGLVEPEDGDA